MKRDGFLKDVMFGPPGQRSRPLDAARPGAVPAERQFLGPADRRLFASATRNAARRVYLPAAQLRRRRRSRRRRPSRRSTAASAGSSRTIPFQRKTAITPGRNYRSDVKDGGVSGEVVYDFGAAELTSITAYRYNKYVGGQDADFNNLDIIFRADDGGYGNKFKTFTQELRLQGNDLERPARLAGRRLLRRREAARSRQSRLRHDSPLGRLPDPLNFAGVARQLRRLPHSRATICSTPFARASLPTSWLDRPGARGHSPATRALIRTSIARNSPAQVVNTPLGNRVTGDVTFDHGQTGKNYALFTHNIFKITDQLSLTLGARYTMTQEAQRRPKQTTNRAVRLRSFARGSRAAPRQCGTASPCLQRLASGAARRRACVLNSVTAFRRRRRREQALGHGGAELQADRPAADLRQLSRAATRRAASTSTAPACTFGERST